MSKVILILIAVVVVLVLTVFILLHLIKKEDKKYKDVQKSANVIIEKERENEKRKESLATGDAGTAFDNSLNIMSDLAKGK